MKTKTKLSADGAFSISSITKSSVWDMQENDIIRLWQAAEKEGDIIDNARHYMDITRIAFEMEELKIDKPEIIKKYEQRGMKVATLPYGTMTHKWGIKKRPIARVTDLTYENIRHISASKLLEVIERNFGGGWDSLSQAIRDIIESGFNISTTILPADRLKMPGGMYEMKVADGFEVLEIEKGKWIEAIFAKAKPAIVKTAGAYDDDDDTDNVDGDDELDVIDDSYNKDDDDDIPDDDELTAESYRTTIDENPEDLDITVDDLDDDEY
ncbi:MAG: hypothetical protein ACI3Y5_00360 [Prevotella sp.]